MLGFLMCIGVYTFKAFQEDAIMEQMLYQFQRNQRDYFSNDTFRGRSLVSSAVYYEVTPPDILPLRHIFGGVTATAFYTQNRSLIHTNHNKTPYELVHDKKPDLKFLRVFGALCYPTNNSEDLGKLRPTFDIGIFVGYAPNRKGYRIYNKRTRKIMETIHVQFDELTKPMALVHIPPYVPPTNKELEILFQPIFDEYFETPSVEQPIPPTPAVQVLVILAVDRTIKDNPFAQADNDPFENVFAPELSSAESSSGDVSATESDQVIQPHDHLGKWSKDHPMENIIGDPSRLVSTRKQLATDALWCFYNFVLSKVKPKNFKSAVTEDCWFEAMQEEIHEFD
ncbi:putative ribonuclease H-like domain-containing protein [Tanacetum coccineum]